MRVYISLFLFLGVILINFSSANLISFSNESIEAFNNLTEADKCFKVMKENELPTARANETLNEAKQLYDAQISLEKTGRKGKYELVLEYSQKVCNLEKLAIQAKDEIKIFNDTYYQSRSRFNLSSMELDYKKVIDSYDEERFEETSVLIDLGYKKLSEIESSQTTFNLFYQTTTKSIKSFFVNNWKIILSVVVIGLIVLYFSWKTIRKFMFKMKIRQLELRRDTLKSLIKKAQYAYFEKKTMSETEFSVKLQTFKNMIRDIDRQIPELKEQIVKINKLKKK